MAAGLTLDSGALIAADKGDRRFWTLWKEALRRDAVITLPAGVLAQVWRGDSAVIARVLQACDVEPLPEELAKQVGRLLTKTRTSDVVDASVVVGAAVRGDAIVTSDSHDIERLGRAMRRQVKILRI